VVGEKQFNASSSGLDSGRAGNADFHTFADRIYTAGYEAAGTGRLNEADTAGALVAFAMIKGAQRGDLKSAFLRSFKNGKTGINLERRTFDLNIY
jgi:hypothetical protein